MKYTNMLYVGTGHFVRIKRFTEQHVVLLALDTFFGRIRTTSAGRTSP